MSANPNDPRVIGKTPDGKPIFLDPKDLILTPDECLQLGDNISMAKRSAIVSELTEKVFTAAARFIEQTILNTGGNAILGAHKSGNSDRLAYEVRRAGYEMIQDGLKTAVKFRGSIIREMVAKVDSRFSAGVERRVRMIVNAPSN